MTQLSCLHAVKRTSATKDRPAVAPLYTDIAFIGDRSGSMSSTRGGSQTGACDYMKNQKKAANNLSCLLGYFVDFTTFDGEIEHPFSGDAIEINDAVLELMREAMTPRGCTRLYDTILDSLHRQVKRLEDKFGELPAEVKSLVKDQPWLFAASCSPMTDGLDNQSAVGANAECKAALNNYQHNYSATAMVLAANQDASDLAEALGLTRDSGLQMGTTGDECEAAMSSVAAAQFRSITSGGCTQPSIFTQFERVSSYRNEDRVQSYPMTLGRPRQTRLKRSSGQVDHSPFTPESLRVNANVIIPPPPSVAPRL